jgi:hypothetical protein
MTKSPDDAQEQERAKLKILVRWALAEGERLKAEARALRKENARLKRLRDQAKRNASGAS